VNEIPFFFERGNVRLFAIEHLPGGGAAAGPTSAFVFSHPFGEEKLWSHRVCLSLARELAAQGHVALRFDYTGAGDSGGLTADSSLDTCLEDLGAAVATLRRRHPGLRRIGLIGLRLGASIAALFAERAARDESLQPLHDAPLVLWDPVIDGASYLQELLRTNLSTQLAVYGKVIENRESMLERLRAGDTVNVDGYEISQQFFDSFSRTDLLPADARAHRGPALIVQVSPTESAKDRPELVALASRYARGRCLRVTEQPFWREIKAFYARANALQDATLRWLENP
jgi:exosortase A-associated hydrolase 2